MTLPPAWWAVVHAIALFLVALLVTLPLAPPPGTWMGHGLRSISAFPGTLLVALLLLGALLGLHGRPHRATWVCLSGLALLGAGSGLLGYLLPWGQVSFFLAAHIGAAPMGPYLSSLAPLALPLALLAVLLRHIGQYWRLRPLPAVWLGPVLLLALFALALEPPAPQAPAPGPFADTGEIMADVATSPPANPLATPAHILPPPQLLPFYAILRAVPGKTAGLVALVAVLGAWVALPWLDRHHTRPLWVRPTSAAILGAAALCLLALAPLGAMPLTPAPRAATLALAVAHLALLLVALPLAARRLPQPPLRA